MESAKARMLALFERAQEEKKKKEKEKKNSEFFKKEVEEIYLDLPLPDGEIWIYTDQMCHNCGEIQTLFVGTFLQYKGAFAERLVRGKDEKVKKFRRVWTEEIEFCSHCSEGMKNG